MRPLTGGGGGGSRQALPASTKCVASSSLPCRGGPATTSRTGSAACPVVWRRSMRSHTLVVSALAGGPREPQGAPPAPSRIAPSPRSAPAYRRVGGRRHPGLSDRASPASPGPESEAGPASPAAPRSPGQSNSAAGAATAASAGGGDRFGPLATPGPLNVDPLGSADEDTDVLGPEATLTLLSDDDDDDDATTTVIAAVEAAASDAGTSLPPRAADAAAAAGAGAAAEGAAAPRGPPGKLYPPSERTKIAKSWNQLMRWSRKNWKAQHGAEGRTALDAVDKVVVFGGGSFGTAMAAALARQKPALDVVLLLRDPSLVADINAHHVNARYLPGAPLPHNVRATSDAGEAIGGAQYALHAVPVQHSRAFLRGVRDILPITVPVISVSKGLEVGTGALMSDLIPDALGRKQPTAFLSGPSFAAEVMARAPTGLVAASRDKALKREVQGLFASPYMRVNTSSDVVGVEVCGALKNVLAIASGIVEGLELGMNARAALVAQGCAEIRWLAEKMGAKPATVAGLSGLGDIMLTCYGSLSRNRSVGVRLGKGERLAAILASSSQVAEGVATAGVVVALASRYHVQLPVLTAVAQVLAGALSPEEAVAEIMGLPQVEER